MRIFVCITFVALAFASSDSSDNDGGRRRVTLSHRVARSIGSERRCDMRCPRSTEPCIRYECLYTDIGKECVAVRHPDCETPHPSRNNTPAVSRACDSTESRFCPTPGDCNFVMCVVRGNANLDCIPGADASKNGRRCNNGAGVCVTGLCAPTGGPPSAPTPQPALPPTPGIDVCSATQVARLCPTSTNPCVYMSCVTFNGDEDDHICGLLPNISANGVPCNDENVLTIEDKCSNGVCVGRSIFVPPSPPRPCTAAEYNASCAALAARVAPCGEVTCAAFCDTNGVYTPACNVGVNVSAVGMACDDNNTLTHTDVCCTDGVCRGNLIPTSAPTVPPTTSPSQQPTRTPSQFPSLSPTVSPTHQPSRSPTQIPSFSPTNQPSALPTQSPSLSPSASPTQSPSLSPSASPTQSPSLSPSASPTQSPSLSPSASPTQSPSLSPSVSPSQAPSLSPSVSPSQAPSLSPSASPSVSPTTSPSQRPSSSPTRGPTLSPTPSPTFTFCNATGPDVNGTCGFDSGGGDCTCACYDPFEDSYCGACDFGNPILCDPSTVPVCRETAYGLTAVVAVEVNTTVDVCGYGEPNLPDCVPIFSQMLAQILADMNLNASNVIVSNAECALI